MRRGYLALGTLALIWGASFLFIKLAVRDMSPATLLLSRTVFGAVTVAVIFAARRHSHFPHGTTDRLQPFHHLASLGSLQPRVIIAFRDRPLTGPAASML